MLLGGAGGILLAAAFLWLSLWWHSPGPLQQPRILLVTRGGVSGIGRQLASAGVIDAADYFAAAVKLLGPGEALKAGEYAFPAAISPSAVASLLISGHTVVHRLIVPEGLTIAEIKGLVSSAPALTGEIASLPPEGALKPETYFYSYGDNRQHLIDRMREGMSQELAALWAQRAPGLPLSNPGQAVALASIVEKETAIPAERARIAAVFYNRLRRGMPLQSDPTVAYALTSGQHALPHPLSHADLAFESPYNTYARAGLPPGPIANPGRASLLAVLHPDTTDALYFVADGSGGHSFSANLEQHNLKVQRWRALQAQMKATTARR